MVEVDFRVGQQVGLRASVEILIESQDFYGGRISGGVVDPMGRDLKILFLGLGNR
jgi:hypothetical protein